MRGEEIIEVVIERIKTELNKSKEVLEAELTPEQAERVGSVLTQATLAAAGALDLRRLPIALR